MLPYFPIYYVNYICKLMWDEIMQTFICENAGQTVAGARVLNGSLVVGWDSVLWFCLFMVAA